MKERWREGGEMDRWREGRKIEQWSKAGERGRTKENGEERKRRGREPQSSLLIRSQGILLKIVLVYNMFL